MRVHQHYLALCTMHVSFFTRTCLQVAGRSLCVRPRWCAVLRCAVPCRLIVQGRTGPYFQDFNQDLIEDLLARYPNLVSGFGGEVVEPCCSCCFWWSQHAGWMRK